MSHGSWARCARRRSRRARSRLSQARAWGVTRKMIELAVRATSSGPPLSGRVRASRRGARSGSAVLRRPRSVVSPHAVVCDRTAAWIWGVDCLRVPRTRLGAAARDRARCAGTAPRGAPRFAVVRVTSEPRDWVEVGGVRVTTPLRTALDLACSQRRRTALAVLDRFMREHGITLAEMLRELPRYVRRRGVIQMRELVRLGGSASRVRGRVVDPARDHRPRIASAAAAVLDRHRGSSDVPARPGVPQGKDRHRVQRRGVSYLRRRQGGGRQSASSGWRSMVGSSSSWTRSPSPTRP